MVFKLTKCTFKAATITQKSDELESTSAELKAWTCNASIEIVRKAIEEHNLEQVVIKLSD